jgi:hypothetical protein
MDDRMYEKSAFAAAIALTLTFLSIINRRGFYAP